MRKHGIQWNTMKEKVAKDCRGACSLHYSTREKIKRAVVCSLRSARTSQQVSQLLQLFPDLNSFSNRNVAATLHHKLSRVFEVLPD